MTELPRLSSAEAAARLGVRLETLYAYVSRGQITRFRDGAGSTFDPLEVERLAAGRRRRGQAITRQASPAGTPLMILDTDIALIEDGRLYLRGRDIAGLVDRRYEDLAGWLWHSDETGAALFTPESGAVEAARAVVRSMPEGTGMIDLIMVATRALAVADPLRHDLSPGRVIRAAGALLGGLIAALPDHPGGTVGSASSVADRLWPKLTAAKATRPRIGALNAALVVLIDHDLAASTLAARTAASARADPYGVVSAGLATLDSALHGTASVDAYRLLVVRSAPAPRWTAPWPRPCAAGRASRASVTCSIPDRIRAPPCCSTGSPRCPARRGPWT